LGDLERAVMNVLWASPQPLTAKAVGAGVGGDHAVTTVLTVLSRLERKGVVARERAGRAHTYRAVASREDHAADLMREALGTASDTDAALARFVSAASPAETAALRRALNRLGGDVA
jgi:predicted transcriptional regulator